MEQPDICDAVLDTAAVPDGIRTWVMGRSVEAAEVRDQVASIVRFLDDLDAAIGQLGTCGKAYELSRQVRAEMIQDLLSGAAKHLADEGDVVGHPAGSSSFGHRTRELRRRTAKLVAPNRGHSDKERPTD